MDSEIKPKEHDELLCNDLDCPLCTDIHDVEDPEVHRLEAAADEAYAHWKDEGRHDR